MVRLLIIKSPGMTQHKPCNCVMPSGIIVVDHTAGDYIDKKPGQDV
jgi:hypothetical protein